MKLDELKEVATAYGVDASAMRKKADVIAAIKEAKAAANEADDDQTGDNPFNEVGSSLPEVSRDPNEYEMGPGQINIMEPCLLYTSRCV